MNWQIKPCTYKTCLLKLLTCLNTISLMGMSRDSARCWDVFTPAPSLDTSAIVLITKDQMSVLLQCVGCCSMLIHHHDRSLFLSSPIIWYTPEHPGLSQPLSCLFSNFGTSAIVWTCSKFYFRRFFLFSYTTLSYDFIFYLLYFHIFLKIFFFGR